MDFGCPYPGCGKPVSLRDAVCRHCQQPLGFGAIVRLQWRRLSGGIHRQTQVACPSCGEPLPLSASTCPACAAPLGVEDAVDRVLNPVRQRWEQFKFRALGDPARQRRIQWAHLLLSGLILWLLVGYVAQLDTANRIRLLGLCSLYLAVISFVTTLVAPEGFFRRIARWGWRVKLGLVCNYFSLLLVLQLFIGAFWTRAVTLAALFGVTLAATFLFRMFLSGPAEPSSKFDHTAAQGRRARFDR